jgi:hypothetical protein
MQDVSAATVSHGPGDPMEARDREHDSVSTHVLVGEDQVCKLRELSRKTRIAQSEYLREAVDDLLTKYGRLPRPEEP